MRGRSSALSNDVVKTIYTKVSFRPVVTVGYFVLVDGPPSPLTETGRQETRRLDEDSTDAFHEVTMGSAGPYCVCSGTATVAFIVWSVVSTSVGTERVTKVPTGPSEIQSSAATGGEPGPRATTSAAAIVVGARVPDSRDTSCVGEDAEEYVTERLAGHPGKESSMQYGIKKCLYYPPADTQEPSEVLSRLFTDRYWRAIRKKRSCCSRPQR